MKNFSSRLQIKTYYHSCYQTIHCYQSRKAIFSVSAHFQVDFYTAYKYQHFYMDGLW